MIHPKSFGLCPCRSPHSCHSTVPSVGVVLARRQFRECSPDVGSQTLYLSLKLLSSTPSCALLSRYPSGHIPLTRSSFRAHFIKVKPTQNGTPSGRPSSLYSHCWASCLPAPTSQPLASPASLSTPNIQVISLTAHLFLLPLLFFFF